MSHPYHLNSMHHSHLLLSTTVALATACLALCQPVRADENIFNYVKGSETLPKGHIDLYQTTTLRDGKDVGSYHAWDIDSEIEYGVTDAFQISAELKQHIFDIHDNDELRNGTFYRMGGVELAAKYRLNSVFKDGIGVTLRPEIGFLRYDDVGGIIQQEIFVSPNVIFQKNFLDDRLIAVFNAGAEWAWGKKPAEEYAKEFSLQGGAGVAYRFAEGWFIGVDSRVRSEFPDFDLGNHEHTVVFVGPSLHYASEKWWATFTWGNQIWGHGVDETGNRTFAEESRNEFILKIGLNF